MAAPKKSRSKVGVIGLGIIGTRVAANLRSAGHQVYVWSRTPRAAPNFLGSVVEVADLCDVVQLFVSDDGALHEVIRTMAAALRPRHVVLCHATVSPSATRQAAGIVESQGARYLDAPFTGSKMAAQNRQLVYYVGGAKAALDEARPVLEATSRAILHVGGIGDASVIKIATNMLTASTVQTLAEALALVRAAGIDGNKLVEALENNSSRSGTSDLKLPAMIAGNTEPNFSLKHMLKDVRFAQELADKYDLSLPVADTTAEVLALGLQNGWGDQDFSAVTQLYPAPTAANGGRAAEPAKATPAPAVADPVKPIVDGTPAASPPVPTEPAISAGTPVPGPVAASNEKTSSNGAPSADAGRPLETTVSESSPSRPDNGAEPLGSNGKLDGTDKPNGSRETNLPRTADVIKNDLAADMPPEAASAPVVGSTNGIKPSKIERPSINDDDAAMAGAIKESEGSVAAADAAAGGDKPATNGAKKATSSLRNNVPLSTAEAAANREQKSTLQLIRAFFKTEPTEPR